MSEPVNTVILVDSLKPEGVQKGVLLQAPRFDRERFAVRVWALRSGGKSLELTGEFEKSRIPVESVPVGHFNDRKGIVALARKLAEERIGLLNTRSFYPNIIGRVAARLVHVPATVVHYHSTYAHQWGPKIIPYEYLLRESTDAFVCVSQAVHDYVQPLLRLPKARTHIIHNSVDVSEFAHLPEKQWARAFLKLPTEAPVIAAVGRLTQVKDLQAFIRAVPRILDRIKNAVFVLVGEGEDHGKILNLIRIYGLTRSVLLLGPCADMPCVLSAADCVVVPSLVEGFPRIVLECFASRTPVVATPAGGTPEILRDGENALSIPFSSSDAIAAAVIRTLLSPEETRKRCECALRDVQAYDVDDWVRKTQEVFAEAATRHRPEIATRRSAAPALNPLKLQWDLAKFRLTMRMTRHGDKEKQ